MRDLQIAILAAILHNAIAYLALYPVLKSLFLIVNR
jgi:hypothetical protein